jgi:mRNA-degrading endonuclease RelE of RelBE toxin-antitoxin system
MYKVIISKSAEKELNDFSEQLLTRILKSIRKLEANPRPAGCKKLKSNDETL